MLWRDGTRLSPLGAAVLGSLTKNHPGSFTGPASAGWDVATPTTWLQWPSVFAVGRDDSVRYALSFGPDYQTLNSLSDPRVACLRASQTVPHRPHRQGCDGPRALLVSRSPYRPPQSR